MIMTITAHDTTLRLMERPGIISQAWKRGAVFEAPLLEHIRDQGFTGTALDVGANIGNHALWLSLVCGLKVIAFEPLHHEALRQNLALNPAAEVEVQPYALADITGPAHHVGKGKLSRGSGPVEMRTLDSFDIEGVSVIKADVEDMEPAVFRGGEKTIRRDRPVIYAEAWNDASFAEQEAVLRSWGYRSTREFEQRSHYRGRIAVHEWRPE